MAGFPLSFLTERIFGTDTSNDTNILNSRNNQALLELLDGLSNGETIVGKVLSSNDKSFKILTNDNVTISARAEAGLELTEGQSVMFEVQKGQDSSKVTLRPLYQNTNTEATAEAALRQAGIPVNERSIEMTARNMEYGNPIDRNALLDSYKDVMTFTETPVKYIVDLQKMDIPRTELNLTQYESYMNMENSVSEALNSITDSLLNEISETLSSGFENVSLGSETVDFSLFNGLENFVDKLPDVNSGSLSLTSDEVNDFTQLLKNNGFSTVSIENIPVETDNNPGAILKALLADLKTTVLNSDFTGVNVSISETGEDGTVTEENSATLFDASRISELINDKAVKNLFMRTLGSQWSLEKENTGDKQEVKDLYSRLFSETKGLSDALSQSLPKDSPVLQNLNNLSNNIEFMNALNSYTPYIQIPFRTDGSVNNSELYVFKNKKGLGDEGGELSAFIHLDMETLGPTDVYVKLNGQHVTTNFTLKDEETLEFIESNLPFLNRRLAEKGYSLESKFETIKGKKAPVQTMLSNTTSRIMVAKTSFDARV